MTETGRIGKDAWPVPGGGAKSIRPSARPASGRQATWRVDASAARQECRSGASPDGGLFFPPKHQPAAP